MRHISKFSYRTVNDWNSYPSSVVLSNSVRAMDACDAWKEYPLKFDAVVFSSVVP